MEDKKKSMQVCNCCGWSKITTYQGLRTHQGKMGCTVKRTHIPEHTQQVIFNTYLPKFTYSPPFEQHITEDIMRVWRQMYLPGQMLDSATVTEIQNEQLPDVLSPLASNPVLLFGSPQQPLQLSDQNIKTHSALDSMVGTQQTQRSFRTPTLADVVRTERENSSSIASTHPTSSQPVVSALCTSTQPQTVFSLSTQQTPSFQSVVSSADVVKHGQTSTAFDESWPSHQTQSFQSALTFGVVDETTTCLGTTLPSFSNFDNRNQNPAVFDGPWRSPQTQSFQSRPDIPADVKDGGETKPCVGTTLTSTSNVSNNNQTQAAFRGSSGPQMFQLSTQIPGPFQTQPTAAQNMPPPNNPTKQSHDGTLTGSSSGPTSSGAKASVKVEDQKNAGGVQQQIGHLQTLPTFANFQKTLSQTLSSQPGPRTTEQVSTTTPSTRASTGAPQYGQRDLQTGPATPQAAPPQEANTFFETPPPNSNPSTAEGNKTRRALDFSTGAHQAETSLTVPTTTAPTQLPLVDDQRGREAEKLNQLQRDRIKAELQQKIRSREQKLCEIRASVKECKGSLDAEWLEIDSVFSAVIYIVEEARQRALQPLENRRETLKRKSQSLIKKIQEEIDKLETAIKEAETAADLDIVWLSKIGTKDTQHNVNTTFSFGTIQTTISSMVEQIQEELGKISALELQRVRAFEVDVTLDPTTAHQWLVVSKDGKTVKDSGRSQPLAGDVGRFDLFGSVLASLAVSGKSYWEVTVGHKTGWDLGVASDKANRKGKLTLSPDSSYWAIVHYEGDKYAALTSPPVCVQLKSKPQKVGVFVDLGEGLLSFYNVTDQSLIYSFTKCSFDGEIIPYFSPHLRKNGRNAGPLVITPVDN